MQTTKKGTRAVVIGSGFGGLAAAIRLGARGWDVTVLERHDQPGGRARVFRDGGFVFDAGPTVITAPFLFEELWQLCGKKMSDHLDLRPVDPFYRIRFADGGVFDYSGDGERMKAQIAALSPEDVAGYERFVAMSQEIFDVGFERLAHVPFGSWLDMARIAPQMVRLESYRTVYGLVEKFVKNDKLRQVLSFHPLLVGGNPFRTTSIYSLIPWLERKWGVHFPIGGTGALVRGLVDLVEGQGGRIRYGATVEEILVENGRTSGVRLADGEIVPADIVVSNADSAFMYRRMLPERYRRRWTDKKLGRARYSMSLFVWYFGTNRKYEDVAHHTILLGPRYRELLEDIFERRVLAEDFSLYLHRPTATDPNLAPPGCEGFYVLSPVPHLDAGIDWAERSEPYRKAIEAHLEQTVLPGLSRHVVASRWMTPQHFQDELLSERGAAFGLEPVLTQSAYFRPHNRSEEVEGLFLVGAGTHPGAGVPGVLSSARVLDGLVPHAA
jgi:phytoene desaturase